MPVISLGDYDPPKPHICAGCGLKIADKYYLLAVDQQWHAQCLTCYECKVPLDTELTCFARDGQIYCKDDYYRLFPVKRCARCQRGIFANELVMRARDLVYHLHCFTCAWCNTPLTQGDYLGLKDNLVYCRAHYELMMHGDYISSSGGPEGALAPHDNQRPFPGLVLLQSSHEAQSPVAAASAYSPLPGAPTGTTGVRKGRPRKRKVSPEGVGTMHPQQLGLSMLEAEGCNIHLPSLDPVQGASQPQGLPSQSGPQRTKRMRTSFKHHQLRTMKSYFSINQNPDAKDLKQLAQKTGLSKRVLQVWFQNARAKWRRNNLKQMDPSHGGPGQQNPPQQPPQPPHVTSPGATSSFSEPSPGQSTCGGALGQDPPSSGPNLVTQSTVLTNLDYENSRGMTPIPQRHIAAGTEGISISSYQELY